jgi:hypothetical protein
LLGIDLQERNLPAQGPGRAGREKDLRWLVQPPRLVLAATRLPD